MCQTSIPDLLNVNLGYNKELMDNCKTLHDYAVFVDLVRKYQKTEKSLKTAVSKAIDECIAGDILAGFLKLNKSEVLKMSIYEYNEAKQMQFEREEGREEGRKEGREEGWRAGTAEERQNSIKNLIEVSQELESSREDTVRRIVRKYALSEEEAQSYMAQYWKVP